MVLQGETGKIANPGQFINIKIDDSYKHILRRPISICDYDESTITIIYKVLGEGTDILSHKKTGETLDVLCPLGNGFSIKNQPKHQLIIGGGIGVPPLYRLAKEMSESGMDYEVVIGFQSKKDIILLDEFKALGVNVSVTTDDGSFGYKGNVLEYIEDHQIEYDYYYACGPQVMLHALIKEGYEGQLSFEERMGCGFGACMGCTHKTKNGYKRICVEGPVLEANEVII